MEQISFEKAKEIAIAKGLSPGRVKNTKNAVQFTRGANKNVEVISWEEFERCLSEKNLAVYSHNGWMKIMRKKDAGSQSYSA